MTIGKDYLLKKPSGPSASKVFFDTRVVPWAVNGAAEVEGLLVRSSARTGVRPAVILASVTGMVFIAVVGLLRRRNRSA